MRLRSVLVLTALGLGACQTEELPAPTDYAITSGVVTDSDGGDVALTCSDEIQGAIGARLLFTPMAQGGNGSFTWSATDLPPGITINQTTGELSGIPEMEGDFVFEVSAMDTDGASGSTMCMLNVAPRIDTTLDLGAVPHCAIAGQSLRDFVLPMTGDGTDVICDTPPGSGNGRVPAGITVNPECQIEGTITENRFGTWVFMVRGTQSEAEVWVPYCVTNDQQPPGSYDITVTHSGAGIGANGTLIPIVQGFDPAAPLSVGGMMDPLFEIIDPTACGTNACFFGFAFGINASPFDSDTFSLAPDELIFNMDGDPIGFQHELSVSGPPVPPEFRDRPWVLSMTVDYCLTADQPMCAGVDNIRGNGNGNLESAIVMVPE